MKYDLNLTFGEIFNNDPKALLDQLINIQRHTADRKKAEKWVDRLRLIDISHVPSLVDKTDAKTFSYTGESMFLFSRRKERLVLPLLEKQDDDGEIPYVAVSWRWTMGKQLPQWGCDARESFDYMVQRPGKEAHKSRFPDHYFDRVIMYAQSQGIDRIWIDKECIFQEPDDDPEDCNLGVQIMDAVYEGCASSVGLLTTSLMRQYEIDLLAELLAGSILQNANDTDSPRFKWTSTMETKILKVQTLILRILSDARWSRGWIFQEDHLASNQMNLLLPCSEQLDTDTDLYNFGTLPGNLVIKLSALRRAVTMFCMASSEPEQRWPICEMLGKAKQYNIYNKRSHRVEPHPRNKRGVRIWTDGNMNGVKMNKNVNYFNETTYPSTTLSLMEDICHRDLEKQEDRIAIMANAAKFSYRLDSSASSDLVTSDAYSLSAIFLALILLNGEIMKTSPSLSHDELMAFTLRQYLQEVQYRFNAPTIKYEQSFINHCRLKESTITQRGVEAPGFLFRLLPNRKPSPTDSKPNPLKLRDCDRKDIERLGGDRKAHKILPGRKFNLLAEEVIMNLIRKMRRHWGKNCKLADFLEEKLDCDSDPPPPEETLPSTPYVLDMMVGLVQALIDDRELRFAVLDGEPDTAQPSAIFIAPFRGDGWAAETLLQDLGIDHGLAWVFTSWDNGWRRHGMERLASMEVAPFTQGPKLTDPVQALTHWDSDRAASSFLRSYGWINGVWNVEGKKMSRFTFQIAGLTDYQRKKSESVFGSRKRTSDDADLSE